MILFLSDGRLGNQLFQYLFLKSIDNQQLIISDNFDDILTLFDQIDYVLNIENKYIKFFLKKIAPPLLHLFVKMKLISSCKIHEHEGNGFLVLDTSSSKTHGLFPITYIYPCFAQSELFFKRSEAENLILKKVHLDNAKDFLALLPSDYNKVFIHIRRGDYINFSVLGKADVTLPISYYKYAIKWFETNLEKPFFVFLTDDSEFVESHFKFLFNKVISRNNQYVDFGIITLCEYGVMANSSFSWWAAYLMGSRKKVFSPKYWLGWKSKTEWPKGIKPSFSEEIEV